VLPHYRFISVKWLTDSQGLTGPNQTDKNIDIKCSTDKNIGISVTVNISSVEADRQLVIGSRLICPPLSIGPINFLLKKTVQILSKLKFYSHPPPPPKKIL
jgi:hypothetical protein